MQKKNLPIILIILATLVIGGYLLLRNDSNEDKNTPTQPKGDTTSIQVSPGPDPGPEPTPPSPTPGPEPNPIPHPPPPVERQKPIAINLSHFGNNGVKWNPEINEGDIHLTFTFLQYETIGSQGKEVNITRTITKGSPEHIQGSYKFCPSNSLEKKIHNEPVKVTLKTKVNGSARTDSFKLPKNVFKCKC